MAKEESESIRIDSYYEYIREIPTKAITNLIKGQAGKNEWFLLGVLGISTIQISPTSTDGVKNYKCLDVRNKLLTSINIPDNVPLETKVLLLRTALRTKPNGHNFKGEACSNP